MKIKINKTIEEDIDIELPIYRKTGSIHTMISDPYIISVYNNTIISTLLKYETSEALWRNYNADVITTEEFIKALHNTFNNIKSNT